MFPVWYLEANLRAWQFDIVVSLGQFILLMLLVKPRNCKFYSAVSFVKLLYLLFF